MDPITGTWSLYTVVIAGVMVLISLVLMVVLLALAMLGRFRRLPIEDGAAGADIPEPEDGEAPEDDIEQLSLLDNAIYHDPDDLYDGFEPEPSPPPAAVTKADAKALAEGFSAEAPQAKADNRRKRKWRPTGLWQLVAAMLACIPALMSAAWVDSIYGRLVTFTFGAGLNLALLAAQIFLIVWMTRLQKRLRQSADS
ncbi:hypothetical protein LJC60_10455 [Ruminococcaceae bacterium OttesenSCG-928-D13]|nr:hypothetical protein [Ruminococcaceae bacterium OttesenSCG-928-D13]